METGTFRVKAGLAGMLKGGVIMDVVDAEQAKVAEAAGAAAVMALGRGPADIRRDGGVARMSDPTMIEGIKEAVSIPVMAKARIGHFVEAQVLEALDVDYIDESEVLTPADEAHHIDKWAFKIPFVCGATNLGEALRRIGEGAAMIRSKGEAGTGNVVEAVRHIRLITGEIRRLQSLSPMELPTAAKELQAPLELVRDAAEKGRLPVVLFCAGGIATPADAALMMQLGAEGNFVGSGIFKSSDPERRARAIVEATTHYNDPERVAAASSGLGEAMEGLDALVIPGGESTTIGKMIESAGLEPALRAHHEAGKPILGTCAGLIVCDADHLGFIDATAKRNAFGRQLQSFEADLQVEGAGDEPLRAIFIRAPWVERWGPGVEVLASCEGHPVAIREGSVLAC